MANLDHPIENIVEKFKDHPSINHNGFTSNNFSFQFVSENDVYRVISNTDSKEQYSPKSVEGKC